MNQHIMTTRSKAKDNENINPEQLNIQPEDDIDEHGNLTGFIDYDMEEDPKALEELKDKRFNELELDN